MKPIIVTIYMIACGLMVAFMFFVQWLIYGISESFGIGVGVGVGLTVLLYNIALKVEQGDKKREIIPPARSTRY